MPLWVQSPACWMGLTNVWQGWSSSLAKLTYFFPSGLTSGSFKLLVISRDGLEDREPGRGRFDTIRFPTHATAEVDKAIEILISSTIENLTTKGLLSARTLKSIRHILRTHAEGGIFLWVGIIARDLRGKDDLKVQEILGSVSKDLEGIYQRILGALGSSDEKRER